MDAVTNLLRIAELFDNLDFIDFGGGYGIPYHKLNDEKDFPMEDFKARLEPILDDLLLATEKLRFLKVNRAVFVWQKVA